MSAKLPSQIPAVYPKFPQLATQPYRVTSPSTPTYNCIAWAAGRDSEWWWPEPDKDAFWPATAPRKDSLKAFLAAFATLEYERCADGVLVAEVEKVAFYADASGKIKHAARQLPNGTWTSKLGKFVDLEHTLEALEGPHYGKVVGFASRPRRGSSFATRP